MAGIGFSFKIIGLEQLAKKLKPETVKSPLSEGIKKITLYVHKQATMATPVGTPESTGRKGYMGGSLRASIERGLTLTPTQGKIATLIPYASFVEYGTVKMEARHVEGSAKRVYGLGMFGYGMKKLQEKIGDFLKDIGHAIEVKFGA